MRAIRTKNRRRSVEDDHQIALITWSMHQRLPELYGAIEEGARLSDYLIHIPNGGKRSKSEAARFKAMGTKAGVSDLLLPIPIGCKSGLWVEMKRPYTNSKDKNYPTQEQKTWLARMKKAGYAVAVCYGWQSAQETINRYLGGEHEQL